MRYIYFDETKFGTDNNYIGYGAFASEQEIPFAIINEAFHNLSSDPDISDPKTKHLDKAAIERGYFHASADSKNAHSHFCNSIKDNLRGLFRSDIFDTKQSTKPSQNIYHLSSTLCAMKALNTRENVEVIFEKRNDLSSNSISSSFESLYNDLLKSCYEYPLISVFFPKIDFRIADKNEPGIQCVDFLLWSYQRYLSKKDVKWFESISKGHNSYYSNNGNDEWRFVNLELNINFKDAETYYDLNDFNKEYDENIDYEFLSKILFHVINVVKYYATNELPESLSHQHKNILLLADNLTNLDFPDFIEKIAKAYLMMFDMIPLISDTTLIAEKLFLLATKKYMGLTLHKHLINGIRTSDLFSEVRRLNFK